MSALEQIHAYLMSGYEDWPEPHKARVSPKVMEEAKELYEAVAHELAEKQRDFMKTGVLSIAKVIDLIDPEVSDSGN